jgi:uncharacterized protein YndB with AHSA1/START domain
MSNVLLRRELFVPREIVFDLLTDPAHLEYWYPPTDAEARQFAADAVADGGYRYQWHTAAGAVVEEGRFVVVDTPARLSQTIDSGPDADIGELEILLSDVGGKTELIVRASGAASSDARDACATRWEERFENLESYLSSI